MTSRAETYRSRGLWTDERVGWLMHEAAGRWPRREFVSFQDTRYTYAEFGRWVDSVALDLAARGAEPADCVLVQLPNCLEALVLQLAAFRIGAIACPVVSSCSPAELRHIIDDLRPTVIAAAGDRVPDVANILEDLAHDPGTRFAVGTLTDGWSRFPGPPGDEVELDTTGLPDPAPADECCLILHTSGTTAMPKGVMLTSQAMLCEARQWRLTGGLTFRDVLLCIAPMSHLAGIHGSFLLPATLGARAVVMPKWDTGAALELIDRERVTFSLGAPTFLHDLVHRWEAQPPSKLTLHSFQCGGAPVPPSLIEHADRFGVRAFKAYGMSETAGTCTLGRPDDPVEILANNEGYLNEGVEMQAVDDRRNPLPMGQIGELRIRSPQTTIGYRNPALTAERIDSDGWFYTGDLGVVSPDRTVRIAGRIKDVINRGGEKVSALEIEDAICSHPSIASAAVVGIPDERLGEVVAAAVTLRDGGQWDGPQPLLDHLQTIGLSQRKRPVTWLLLDELPATASGKVKKNDLIRLLQRPSTSATCRTAAER